MRSVYHLREEWIFIKDIKDISSEMVKEGERVTLPHTWNAQDGQDGGNDYFRGSCCYVRSLRRAELPQGEKYYLEITGANSSAQVFLNGRKLAEHDGGYSTWRVDITAALQEENQLAVLVDNAPNERVYPQTADFTFYGGLYREVNIIAVSKAHFDLSYYGSHGVKVTPIIEEQLAKVELEAFVQGAMPTDKLCYALIDAQGQIVAEKMLELTAHIEVVKKQVADVTGRSQEEVIQEECLKQKSTLSIIKPHLWQGRKAPYLYTAKVSLCREEEILDEVSLRFGCRSFEIDPEKGFILNGEPYPLRGVSRHQDRLGIGNALLPKHHREDMELIAEMGANTIRLAHYQHDSYFYDLCDEYGMVVWAEIPYISNHMSTGNENTILQMRELVVQNYHHPSIVVWGLSNEITMGGVKDPDLLRNHRVLNDMVHAMDKTRLTTVACLSMCGIEEEYVHITDVVSYNHYFGWYGGDTSMNGPWFDKFHAKYPDRPIGVSEYGCEGLNWHNSNPQQGDYTEEYQAYYHEELIKQLFTRPFIWATHVWNMFDFGADARSEGGENGQNHKGLVTMDRSYKKDAFYAYKAWLSDEPFVHLCGKRYVDRVEELTKVTVYSNQPEVELFVNGESLGRQRSEEHFFYFMVPNKGESTLLAVAGTCQDEGKLRKVEEMNQDYILKEKGAVLNWFDVTAPEGRFSLNDKLAHITATFMGKLWFLRMGLVLKSKMSANKKAKKDGKEKNSGGFQITKEMVQMVGGFTVLRLTGMVSMIDIRFTKEELLKLNSQLNRIKKPEK